MTPVAPVLGCPDAAIPGRKDERVRVGPPARETPLSEMGRQRRQESDGSALTGLRCLHVSKRRGAVDENRPLADIAPPERERFARSEPGVRQHRESVASRTRRRASNALRISSTFAGEIGRTVRVRLCVGFRIGATGFDGMRPQTTARWSIPWSSVRVLRIVGSPTPSRRSSAWKLSITAGVSRHRSSPPSRGST